ncbi:hypothetical protein BJ684DRAFT_20515 [Piptocephalis cylindrospora]|uniref:Uncharacterized protein n=1 Tax=Piptocephalis cylindrospora TaxID=1907219 RepID=A0A4P9Y2Y6_9FUNG|nr:hypothetical protein BJ684DRAFT_20515 [Piptocephalis cylindrospora]|eukprot:RKP12972.1 hypothetical protein BJ684DRAFT_20515 [Piptocephalis cylindrospora]
MTEMRKNEWIRPDRWHSSTWAQAGYVITGLDHIVLYLIQLIDVPSPYWVRMLLQFSSLPISYGCLIPYLNSLLSPRFVVLWKRRYHTSLRARARYILFSTPLILILFLVLITLSAGYLDMDKPQVAQILFQAGMCFCALNTGIAAWIFWVYGYSLSKILAKQIHSLKQIPAGSISSSSSAVGHADPKSKTPSSSRTMLAITERPTTYSNLNVHITIVEANAILGTMRTLNSIFVVISLIGMVVALLCAIFPVKIYTSPALSKTLFFFGGPNRITANVMVSVSMYFQELKRIRERGMLREEMENVVEDLCIRSNQMYEQLELMQASTSRLTMSADPHLPSIHTSTRSDVLVNPCSL